MKQKTIRELGGEIWAEIDMEKRLLSQSALNCIPFEAENTLIELIMGVLARYAGSELVNDEDFPVFPRKKVPQPNNTNPKK